MRREMPSWAVLPANASEKTTTIVHKDFTSYTPELVSRLREHDACIWAMGKSSLGIAEADYTAFTYNAPMTLATALRDAGVGQNRAADQPFRFIYVSGEHADPTEKSSQMWARVKVCMYDKYSLITVLISAGGGRVVPRRILLRCAEMHRA